MAFAFGPDSIAAYFGAISLIGMGMIAVYAKFREVQREQTIKDREAIAHDMISDLEACRIRSEKLVAELEEIRDRLITSENRCEELSRQIVEMARVIKK